MRARWDLKLDSKPLRTFFKEGLHGRRTSHAASSSLKRAVSRRFGPSRATPVGVGTADHHVAPVQVRQACLEPSCVSTRTSEPLSADRCRGRSEVDRAAPPDGLRIHTAGHIINNGRPSGSRLPRRPASRVDGHHFPAPLSRRRPSAHSGLIDGSGFARAAESPRTLLAYTEWRRLDLTVRRGAGRASATC